MERKSLTLGTQATLNACFIGYIVQAIANNFVPLLFVTFQTTYQIPLSRITLLITINFVIQLLIDFSSALFVDKIGYRASIIIAHICSALGLSFLTFLPELFQDPFTGILISVIVYAIGGGLIEVLISPIVEACPSKNKEKAMSPSTTNSPLVRGRIRQAIRVLGNRCGFMQRWLQSHGDLPGQTYPKNNLPQRLQV